MVPAPIRAPYNPRVGSFGRYIVAVASVALAVAVLELLGPSVNGATAAQVLLLVLLIAARFCGTGPAIVALLCAVAGFSRYFVTATGLAVGDPSDWAALAAFIIMAVVVGELASRAERRAARSAGGPPGDRAALSGTAGGVRSRERSGSRAPQRTAQGGAARRADAQPAHAADGDQGVGHGAHRRSNTPRRIDAVPRGAPRAARGDRRGIRSAEPVHRGAFGRRHRFASAARPAGRPRRRHRADGPGARRNGHARLSNGTRHRRGPAAAVCRRRVDRRSAVHPARQREQVRAAGIDDPHQRGGGR